MTPLARLEWLRELAADANLTDAARRVAMVIADRTHHKSGRAFIATGDIGAELGVCPKTVRRAAQLLERGGWVLYAPGRGRGKATEYAPVMRAEKGTSRRPPLEPEPAPEKGDTMESTFSEKKGTEKGTEKGTPACPPTGVTGGKPNPPTSLREVAPPTANPSPPDAQSVAQSAPPAGRKNGTRWREGSSVPDDWRTWATETTGRAPMWVDDQADRFADYWRAKSGANATKLDWKATWRNWIRKSNDEATQRNLPPRGGGDGGRRLSAVERVRRATRT